MTLDLRLARHQLANSIPRVVAELIDKSEKFFILKLTMSGSLRVTYLLISPHDLEFRVLSPSILSWRFT